ncbi:MAG TPA: hypothetical protein VKF41_09730 [Bryobacteraceae bacterium]|nr:hypothetical protein [Bryobacteraceae bacterium]
MEFCDPYGWHTMDANTIHEIREKLKAFESMTWNQILLTAKKQNHKVPFGDLEPSRRSGSETLAKGIWMG